MTNHLSRIIRDVDLINMIFWLGIRNVGRIGMGLEGDFPSETLGICLGISCACDGNLSDKQVGFTASQLIWAEQHPLAS